MSGADPDVAELIARLGLRGMRYRSFGNRPAGPVEAEAPVAVATTHREPAATTHREPAPPEGLIVPPTAAAPLVEAAPRLAPAAPVAPDFPLLAAALEAASAPPPPVAAEGTLAFLGQRRAGAGHGR